MKTPRRVYDTYVRDQIVKAMRSDPNRRSWGVGDLMPHTAGLDRQQIHHCLIYHVDYFRRVFRGRFVLSPKAKGNGNDEDRSSTHTS